VRELLPISDRDSRKRIGFEPACIKREISLGRCGFITSYDLLSRLQEKIDPGEPDLYRCQDHSHERSCAGGKLASPPVRNIDQSCGSACNLFTFSGIRSYETIFYKSIRKDLPAFYTAILMAMRFLLPKPLVVLPIFQGRPRRNHHRQHNPLQYRRISTSLDTYKP
jgi:hypothetical protein